MTYLLLTVAFNVLVAVFFREFGKRHIDTLQAIVANYFVCILTGLLTLGHFPVQAQVQHSDWFFGSLMIGAGFFIVFNLMAWCTKRDGITTTVIANKLSLVIPVALVIILFHEPLGALKAVGLALSFPAVYLATGSPQQNNRTANLALPILLFLGGGLLDAGINYIQKTAISGAEDQAAFTVCCFAAACTTGMLVVTGNRIFRHVRLNTRSLMAGIILGVPNFFSIFFYIKMLQSPFLNASASLPIMNIAVVVAATLVSFLAYKEKMTAAKLTGLALAIVAILLVAIGDYH